MDFMAAEAQTSEQTICSPALLLPLDFNSTMMNTLGPSPRGSYESAFAPAPGTQHPDGQVAPLADPSAFSLHAAAAAAGVGEGTWCTHVSTAQHPEVA